MLEILVALFTFTFGGILLIVFLGARRIEREFGEIAREAEASRAKRAAADPKRPGAERKADPSVFRPATRL